MCAPHLLPHVLTITMGDSPQGQLSISQVKRITWTLGKVEQASANPCYLTEFGLNGPLVISKDLLFWCLDKGGPLQAPSKRLNTTVLLCPQDYRMQWLRTLGRASFCFFLTSLSEVNKCHFKERCEYSCSTWSRQSSCLKEYIFLLIPSLWPTNQNAYLPFKGIVYVLSHRKFLSGNERLSCVFSLIPFLSMGAKEGRHKRHPAFCS